MSNILIACSLLIFSTLLLNGCTPGECPKDLPKEIWKMINDESLDVTAMPAGTAAQKTAKADAWDNLAKRCKKYADDNKSHDGCTLADGKSWKRENLIKSCDDAADKAKALR